MRMQARGSGLPQSAAWRLLDAHEGFEVLFTREDAEGGVHLDGHFAVVEEGEVCGVRYSLRIDGGWTTQSAHVIARSAAGEHELRVERRGDGSLTVDGAAAPELEGLVDVDFEGS